MNQVNIAERIEVSATKEEKKIQRAQRKEERQKNKEEKKREKEEKKIQRQEEKREKKEKKDEEKKQQRDQREQEAKDDIDLSSGNVWPSQISKVYLDGNNMLFITSALRSHALKKRAIAEKMLMGASAMFHHFHQSVGYTHLLFDDTNFSVDNLIQGRPFKVSAARPLKPTSDDLLVEIAENEGDNSNNCLFVTSDRELRRRLRAQGALVIKPGRFMDYAFRSCNPNSQIEEVDQWLQQFETTL